MQIPQEQLILPKGVTVRRSTRERYIIERLISKGDTGAVYLVRLRNAAGQLFALKEIINPNEQDLQRFTFEGEVLRRLHHKALPRVHYVFENTQLKRVYIVMDYIQGRTLEDLRHNEPDDHFSLQIALVLMTPIVDALTYLHNQEPPIVHRDIKPANVILPSDGEGAMLVDFGSAKEYLSGDVVTVTSQRSPGYAAPEQYGRGTTIRTDIYGLGATLYTLLTGTAPIAATYRSLGAIDGKGDLLKPASALVPSLPTPVSDAIQKAMSLRSDDRFASIEEFWHAISVGAIDGSASNLLQLPSATSASTSARRTTELEPAPVVAEASPASIPAPAPPI